MQTITVHEARKNISELLRIVERGEEVIIQRHGHSVAKLIPIDINSSPFPDRSAFRQAIGSSSKPAHEVVRASRDEERD